MYIHIQYTYKRYNWMSMNFLFNYVLPLNSVKYYIIRSVHSFENVEFKYF